VKRHATNSHIAPPKSDQRFISAGSLALLTISLLVVAAGLLPSIAAARTTRAYESSFGSFTNPDNSYQRGPQALAVDQANGDVYVQVTENSQESVVSRFTSTGAPDDFTAGPGAGTNTLGGFPALAAIAVDRAGGPLDGHFLITREPGAGSTVSEVKIYRNDGALAGVLDGPDSAHFTNTVCGVAVNQSNGDIYIADYVGGRVWRYVPKPSSAPPYDDDDFAITSARDFNSCSIAAHGDGVYVAENTGGGNGELRRYPVTAFTADPKYEPGPLIDEKWITAVDVDPNTGDVYANEGNRVVVYDSSGERLYDFGLATYFGSSSAGIAVKSASSGAATKAYVSDPQPGGKEIDVFGPVTNLPVISHPPIASFGRDGSSGTTAFSTKLDQLAFDQATRNLFALDEAVPGIYGFDASAPPFFPVLNGFAPLPAALNGGRPGLAVDNTALSSTGNIYLASMGHLYGFDSTGAPLGGAFPIDPTVSPGGPGGSPAGLCGVAVDSSANIWVSNAATRRILKYSSAGTPLPGAVDTSIVAKGENEPCRLAFDSSDNLYVGISNVVWRFSAASDYSAATLVDGSAGRSRESSMQTGRQVGGIAVDRSNDHLYVAHYSDRRKGGEFVYFSWIDEFDAAGNFIDEFDAGVSASRVAGITIDSSNHYLYIADAAGRKIRVLGPGAILPEVEIRPVSDIANTMATLNGKVGTQSVALTDCRFEYVTEAAFEATGFVDLSSGGSASCTPAADSIPLDFDTHSVSGTATGLIANTDYRARLVAANASASSFSSDVEFTTSSRPIVETTGAPIRSATSAQLGGRLDPRNAATSYFFEYGDQGSCDASPCAKTEPQLAGSGHFVELVSEEVGGLQPGTTYHYRLVAENGNLDGPAFGADTTVTTRTSDAPLSHGRLPGPTGSDRAWELVSSPENGGNPVEGADVISDDGSRVVWGLGGGSPITEVGGFTYLLSERRSSGWRNVPAYPTRDNLAGSNWHAPSGRRDLSKFTALNYTIASEFALFRMIPGSPGVMLHSVPTEAQFTGFDLSSEDGSRTLMSTNNDAADPLHPTPDDVSNIFDVTTPGSPRLASLLPGDVVPTCGTEQTLSSVPTPYNVNGAPVSSSHMISADGELLFFMSRGDNCTGSAQLYMRDFGAEETTQISRAPVSGPSCGAGFIKSFPDAVFFWSKSRLVAEDTEPNECSNATTDGDVYRYDLGDGSLGCVTCVVAEADVLVPGNQAWKILISEDGSRLYFNSNNSLLPGAREGGVYRLDTERGDLAYVGSPGVEVSVNDPVTPDGSVLFFGSDAPSLNALGAGQGNAGTAQIYRYDDNDRSLVCVSCPQDGSAPRGEALVQSGNGAFNTAPISDDGVFAFTTPTPLVSVDQNTAGSGQSLFRGSDVYEWRDGRLLLVTDGLSDWAGRDAAPTVKGMSPSGRDILFTVAAKYTPDALDDFLRLYDARIGGGFEFPPPPPPCPLEVCQGTPNGAPEEQAPGTGTFSGVGSAPKSPASCRKGKVRRKGRCVVRKPARKHRRANHNRRNAR
jgi:hypothetical protein